MEITNEFNQRMPITALVDDVMVENNKKRAAEHAPGKLYPSSIHKCSRALCYELLGYPRPEMEPRVLKILENGNFVHERYQKMWKDMGIMVAEELPIKEESLKISGRMDALLNIEDHMVIGEIKSAGDSPFSKMKQANAPDPKYVAQLQLYLHLSNIDLGVAYVENKNNQDVLEFWIEYDAEYCTNLFKKLHIVRETADNNKIISRKQAAELDGFMVDQKKMSKGGYDTYSYYCRYCDYRDECYKE